jgi:hypothetical protein
MLQEFVGIVSHEGIELFCPEDPATVRFLLRRMERSSRPIACFWSVLSQPSAALIEVTVSQGRFADALELLLDRAHECGLVPYRHLPPGQPCGAQPA